MKFFSIKFENLLLGLFIIIMAICFFNTYNKEIVQSVWLPTTKKVVIIDAGHGGFDPGKEGIKGENEDHINLSIAKNLQLYLEQSGSYVVITREDENALGNNKKSDMASRKSIINESDGNIFISIHQNAYQTPNVKGAQVFFHEDSIEGRKMANFIQYRLNNFADPTNKRDAKANSSYFVLKQTTIPAVIVECGFLSNPEEEIKLNNPEYQEKIAWSIFMGILDYFEDQ